MCDRRDCRYGGFGHGVLQEDGGGEQHTLLAPAVTVASAIDGSAHGEKRGSDESKATKTDDVKKEKTQASSESSFYMNVRLKMSHKIKQEPGLHGEVAEKVNVTQDATKSMHNESQHGEMPPFLAAMILQLQVLSRRGRPDLSTTAVSQSIVTQIMHILKFIHDLGPVTVLKLSNGQQTIIQCETILLLTRSSRQLSNRTDPHILLPSMTVLDRSNQFKLDWTGL
ncbi:hypothetical protein BJ878DRAFT_86592 [Calycina marina]|uniref:Uncharacterized protein n=1 Tax=Calycina marina TaxID=1763456 RepID=A0A9P7Z2C6_9HELO|nr:hypothetical protein BJ878DRAFT_86592 [Calycina marina]